MTAFVGRAALLVYCTMAAALISCVAAQVGFNDEVDALIEFKKGLIDPEQALQSWDPNSVDPCSGWQWILCDDNTKVIQVQLAFRGLSGTISPSLGRLSNLQFLGLFGNSLSGSVPKELGGLSSLLALLVDHNALTGSIPWELGQLSNLRLFDVSSNQLSGPIPTNGVFAKFSANSYVPGNPGLCGDVINRPC